MIRIFAVLVPALLLQGCLLTKVATVPVRAVGAVVSAVPVVGNPVHDGMDKVADVVDLAPI